MPAHNNTNLQGSDNSDDRKHPSPPSEDPKKKRVYKKRNHYNPTLTEIKNYFNLPLEQAASALNICVSKLKKLCREYGVQKWPSRQLKSAQLQCENLKMLGTNPEDSKNMGVVVDVASDSQHSNGKVFAFVHFCTPSSSLRVSTTTTTAESPNPSKAPSSTHSSTTAQITSAAVQQQEVASLVTVRQSPERSISSRNSLSSTAATFQPHSEYPAQAQQHPQQQQQQQHHHHRQNHNFNAPNANLVNHHHHHQHQHPQASSPRGLMMHPSYYSSPSSHPPSLPMPSSYPPSPSRALYPNVEVIPDEDDEVTVITASSSTAAYQYQQRHYPQLPYHQHPSPLQQPVLPVKSSYPAQHHYSPKQMPLPSTASHPGVYPASNTPEAPTRPSHHLAPGYNYATQYPPGLYVEPDLNPRFMPYSVNVQSSYYNQTTDPEYGNNSSTPNTGIVVDNDHYQLNTMQQQEKEYSGKPNDDVIPIESTLPSLAPASNRHTLCRPIPKRVGHNFQPFVPTKTQTQESSSESA